MQSTAACFHPLPSSSCLVHWWMRGILISKTDYSAPEATGANLCCFLSGCVEGEKMSRGEGGERGGKSLESLYCVFIKHSDV